MGWVGLDESVITGITEIREGFKVWLTILLDIDGALVVEEDIVGAFVVEESTGEGFVVD